MTLVEALIQVESQGNDYAIGDTHLTDRAYGCLQIRKPCLDDVNRACGTYYDPEQMLGNRTLSVWVFEQYMMLYATPRNIGHEPTDKDRARIWNGGPSGWKRSSTLPYWRKVEPLLSALTRAEYLAGLTNPTPSLILKSWPAGNIVQGWGENPALYATVYADAPNLHRELGGHTGTDIQGPKGTPIVAAQEGTVYEVKTDPSTLGGICLWISSPELLDGREMIMFRFAYGHFDRIAVSRGQRVTKGQLLGYMGNTGIQSTVQPYWKAPALDNTHLHFGADEVIWRAGEWIIRYPGPSGGSFDVMAYLTGNTNFMRAFLDRITAYIKGRL